MNYPLYMTDAINLPTTMVLSVVAGFMFGFVLERAGFGNAKVLMGQFYLNDMRVLKVMFSGVVTAVVGIGILSKVGAVELNLLWVPESYLLPYILGGLLLGAGFVFSGYCPGTAIVGIASGNRDALYSILGLMVGGIIFAGIWTMPSFEEFFYSGAKGRWLFTDLTGLSFEVLAVGVVVIALGAFMGGEAVERMVAKKAGEEPPPANKSTTRMMWGLMVAGGVFGLIVPAGEPVAEVVRDVESVEAVELAEALIAGPEDFYVLDLRETAACEEQRIGAAICLPADDSNATLAAGLPSTRTLVVYGAGDLSELPGGVLDFEGEVLTLEGGFESFQAAVLTAPVAPENPDQAQIDAYSLALALHAHYTGVRAEPVVITPRAVTRSISKGGGC